MITGKLGNRFAWWLMKRSVLHRLIAASHHSRQTAVANYLTNGNYQRTNISKLVQKNCVKPTCNNYFQEKFDNNLQSYVELFKKA